MAAATVASSVAAVGFFGGAGTAAYFAHKEHQQHEIYRDQQTLKNNFFTAAENLQRTWQGNQEDNPLVAEVMR